MLSEIPADEQDASPRKWNKERFGPLELTELVHRDSNLSFTDEESQASLGGEQASGGREDGVEALDGAERDEVKTICEL